MLVAIPFCREGESFLTVLHGGSVLVFTLSAVVAVSVLQYSNVAKMNALK